MMPKTRCRPALLFVLALLAAPGAQAERADRDQPINIEADRMSVDDRNKISQFDGRVVMTQGTLTIRAQRVVVSQGPDGFQRGVATGGEGGLARFRQKREGSSEYIEGEAERIEHDGRNEKTELFGRAYVRSGQDEVRGQYILVDGLSERYVVTNAPKGAVTATAPGGEGPRVRAVIQPRPKDGAPAPAAESVAPR